MPKTPKSPVASTEQPMPHAQFFSYSAESAEHREPMQISRAPHLLPSSGLPLCDLASLVAPSVPPLSASAQSASSALAHPSPPLGSPLGPSAPPSRTRRHIGAHAQFLALLPSSPSGLRLHQLGGSHAWLLVVMRRRGPAQVRCAMHFSSLN